MGVVSAPPVMMRGVIGAKDRSPLLREGAEGDVFNLVNTGTDGDLVGDTGLDQAFARWASIVGDAFAELLRLASSSLSFRTSVGRMYMLCERPAIIGRGAVGEAGRPMGASGEEGDGERDGVRGEGSSEEESGLGVGWSRPMAVEERDGF